MEGGSYLNSEHTWIFQKLAQNRGMALARSGKSRKKQNKTGV
jgi:hypothetical protein